MILLPLLIIAEAIMWMLKVETPGDTSWLQWLWLTLGFYLLLGDSVITTVRNKIRR